MFHERFKEISLLKLNELLFLTQLESLVEGYEGGFYPKSFTINLQGVSNKEIESKYRHMRKSILNSKHELAQGKNIPQEKKKVLYRVYKKYGGINEYKLNEILHECESPLNVDKNPVMLSYIMKYNIKFNDEKLEEWYKNFLEEYEF